MDGYKLYELIIMFLFIYSQNILKVSQQSQDHKLMLIWKIFRSEWSMKFLSIGY